MSSLEIYQTAVSPNGDVYSLQTSGHIVRHGNPKAGDDAVEVVYKARGPLFGLAVSPSGALHAVGAGYHTNASGKWVAHAVPVADDLDELLSVWAPSDDDVWMGSEEGQVLRRSGGQWTTVKVGLPKDGNYIYAIRGAGPRCMYVMSDEGVAHFDGRKWQKFTPGEDCTYLDAVVLGPDRCIVVGRDGPHYYEGAGRKLVRVEGITDDEEEDFYAVASRGDDVYIATGKRVLGWNGKTARAAVPTTKAQPYRGCMYVACNGEIVAAGGHEVVHIFDGQVWSTSPARPPNRKKSATNKKSATSKKSATNKSTK